MTGITLEFTYRRSHAAVADGLQFDVEWSDTLGGDWTSSGVTQQALPGSDNGTSTAWTALVPANVAKRFVHLRVTAP